MLPIVSRAFPAWPESSDWADREFGRMLRRMWGNGGETEFTTAAYPVNIREDDTAIHVEAELPGFKNDEIDVTFEQGTLTITAEHKEEKQEEKEGKPLLHERRFRRYQRSFGLPTSVDDENVEAKLSEGVLYLKMPKKAEVRPRRIKVS